MNRKIISYSLLSVKILTLIGSPIVYSYPILTYSGNNVGMHLSPADPSNLFSIDPSKPIYLHVYKGIQPESNFQGDIQEFVNTFDTNLDVKIVKSDALFQKGQHRVIVGPVALENIVEYSQSLQAVGIDSFPVYYVDDTISFITTPQQKNIDNTDNSFEHSAQLEAIATTLANEGNTTELDKLLVEKTLNYIESETENFIASNMHDWLAQYGTAKVVIDLDRNFNLNAGEIELLYPFATNINAHHSSTWFIQSGAIFNGVNLYDGRDFAHVGLGYRYKTENNYFGINAFYDYDLQYSHQRASLGAEYANPYMQLTGNYYFPTSDWKDSTKRFSIITTGPVEERPAEGYDINLSGYLPSLPWLSIDTSYQQYFGDFVQSAHNGDPVNNPSIISASLNYHPIPLLTFTAGYKAEDGREGDTQIGMSLNYRFGVPFNKQIDPSQVGAARSIDAKLFDLVKRDHNIRLEYREKAPMAQITFNSGNVTAKEGDTISLEKWMTISGDKTLVQDVTFEGTAAAHIQNKSTFVAPMYDMTGNSNILTLSATMSLSNGQIVKSEGNINITIAEDPAIVEGNVTIDQGSVTDPNSSTSIVGDETSNDSGVNVSAILKNGAGRPLPGKQVKFTASAANAKSVPDKLILTPEEMTSGENGEISTMLRSNRPGTYYVNILVDGMTIQSKPITFITDGTPPDNKYSSNTLDVKRLVADNKTEATVTLVLHDKFDNPLSNEDVTFTAMRNNVADSQGVTIGPISKGSAGQYIAKIKATKIGSVVIRATVNNASKYTLDSAALEIHADGQLPAVSNSTLSADKTDITIGTKANITVALKDQFNNPLEKRPLVLKAYRNNQLANDVTFGAITEDATNKGTYKATVTSNIQGNVTIKATVQNISGFELSNSNFNFNTTGVAPNALQSIFNITNKSVEAGSTTGAAFALTLKDEHGNLLSDRNVALSAVKADGTPAPVDITFADVTHSNGVYSSALKGTTTGEYKVKAVVDSVNITSTETITITPGSPSNITINTQPTNVEVTSINTANPTANITFVLKDSHGNTVRTEQVVNYQPLDENNTNADNTKTTVKQLSFVDGVYSAALLSTKTGAFTVKLSLDAIESTTNVITVGNTGEAIDMTKSTQLSLSSPTITVGKSTSLSVSFRDQFGNPLTHLAADLGVVVSSDTTAAPVTHDTAKPGTYTSTITSNTVGVKTLNMTYKGTSISGLNQINLTVN